MDGRPVETQQTGRLPVTLAKLEKHHAHRLIATLQDRIMIPFWIELDAIKFLEVIPFVIGGFIVFLSVVTSPGGQT
ncbi:hypothetical protein KOR42_11160 [Thalassoglobus neptunius]|uniref:Uncharacterized protein n=1 Tax=Thalassoglobus neptunius TaxID=1938619 RepID=A0A5C5X4D7_9PLAN|nr:hypothetical protein [Thalassoglobus neptunius]TWT57750.1 hypothetical protein KOR42_11160 [Thalassoglobus neptunius]